MNVIINCVIAFGSLVALCALLYQLRKDYDYKKYEQPNKISCWIDLSYKHEAKANCCYSEFVRISNHSSQPIYDVIVVIDIADSDIAHKPIVNTDYSEYIAYIPDGEYSTTVDWECKDCYSNYNAAIFFRDIRGKYWFRNGRGLLISINKMEAESILSVPKLPLELQRIMPYIKQ